MARGRYNLEPLMPKAGEHVLSCALLADIELWGHSCWSPRHQAANLFISVLYLYKMQKKTHFNVHSLFKDL